MSNARNLARLLPDSSGKVLIPQGGSRLIKATALTNNTRQVFGTPADQITYWSVSYTKESNTSDLYIHVLLPVWSNYNGGNYVGIRIDGVSDFTGSGRGLHNLVEAGSWRFLQKRSGLAAGSRSISIFQDVLDNSANYVIPVLNFNNSEDSRTQQMASVMVIYEIEP